MDAFDWDTTSIPETTKRAIVAFVHHIRTYSTEEKFLVQEFQSFDDAKCVRDIVRHNLVSLGPEIILTPRIAVEGEKGYLVIVKPSPKHELRDLQLFESRAFGVNGSVKCLFVHPVYQSFIKDILQIVSGLMETNVTCDLDFKYLYLYVDGDVAKAKFIKFNLLAPCVAVDETALRSNLVNLFNHINGYGGINDGPLHEFALFNNFLTDAKMKFSDTKIVDQNMIFWGKKKRRNFVVQLYNILKQTGCPLYCSKTAGAFPQNWETIIESHSDLNRMKFYNNQILQEIINQATSSSSSAASSPASSSSGTRSRPGLGYLKDALTFVRHAYEHRYQIMKKGSIQFVELKSDCPDDLVDVFHYYFPDHVMCLAEGPLVTQYSCLKEEFLPLGA